MASCKEHFSKGIGYIKYDIQKLTEQKDELVEFIGYHEKAKQSMTVKIRVSRAKADLESIEFGLKDLNQELKFYKEYFNYTDNELDAIPPATSESLAQDWEVIEKERNDKRWTKQQHNALMKRVHKLDMSLGRIKA